METVSAQHGVVQSNYSILAPAFFGFEPAKNSRPKEPQTNSQSPEVLTVARLAASERYKGHDLILEAWPKVLTQAPSAKYIIVGDGDDGVRLEARTRDLGLAGSVSFKGAIFGDELHACYDRSTIFAMLARTDLDPRAPKGEGFGIVFLEAMANGKPAVGPNVGASAEFLHAGEHGLLVDPVTRKK